MIEHFDTREEADKRAEEINSNHTEYPAVKRPDLKFCPLIKSICRKDCECFVGASVREGFVGDFGNNKKVFIVGGYYCKKAMFQEYRIIHKVGS